MVNVHAHLLLYEENNKYTIFSLRVYLKDKGSQLDYVADFKQSPSNVRL